MLRYSTAALVFALLLTGPSGATPSVEILVPGEHVSTPRCRISVVGSSTAPALRLYLNGVVWGDITVRDSTFHTSLRLPYGLNAITVVPLLSDSTLSSARGESIEILCGPHFSKDQARLFQTYRFHNDQAPVKCLTCHSRDGGAEGEGAEQADWCYPCHSNTRQRLKEHTVAQSRPCTGCHRVERDLTSPDASGQGGTNPCYQCHEDKIGQFAKDYVHGPVAGGSCTVCHDPHGSNFSNTLVSPVPVLCEACHVDISGRRNPVQHYPFEQGWCIECHDPHATSNRWVLQKEGEALCTQCHFRDGTVGTHGHPYGVKPKRPLAVALPLSKSGTLECLSCHEPHASRAPYLLRGDSKNMCLGCHPDGSE